MATVIAWKNEDEICCTDCFCEDDLDVEDEEYGYPTLDFKQVFIRSNEKLLGSECSRCESIFGPDGWEVFDDQWRWAKCQECDKEVPYSREDSESRLLAWKNELKCPLCKGDLHF